MSRGPLGRGAALLSALVLVAAVAVPSSAGAVTLRPPPERAAQDFFSLSDLGCFAGYEEVTNDTCRFGATGDGTLALIGDSHAAAAFPGVNAAAEQRSWGLSVFTKGACPVADVTRWFPRRAYTQCNRWRAWMLAEVARRGPDVVVIVSSFNPALVVVDPRTGTLRRGTKATESWIAGMRRTVRTLTAAGSEVLVLRHVPLVPFNAPSCLIAKGSPAKCRFTRSSSVPAKAVVRGLAHVHYADFTPRFCSGTTCNTAIDGMVVYRDGSHLTRTFALSLADFFVAWVRRLAALG